jgi:hypothetical protein
MGRGEPGIVPGLTTQLLYFRQETSIRQPNAASQEPAGLRRVCPRSSAIDSLRRRFANAIEIHPQIRSVRFP